MKNQKKKKNWETPAPEPRADSGSGLLQLMRHGEWLAALRLAVSKGSEETWRRVFLTVAGVVFLVSGGRYVRDTIRYAGVMEWPSVEAEVFGETGGLNSITTMGRWGLTTTSVDTREAQFEYQVNGQTFRGTRGSADNGAIPSNPWSRPWRAFYKPGSPEIAVLNPSPYEGMTPLFIALVSGVLVVVPLCCAVRDRVSARKKLHAESGFSGC